MTPADLRALSDLADDLDLRGSRRAELVRRLISQHTAAVAALEVALPHQPYGATRTIIADALTLCGGRVTEPDLSDPEWDEPIPYTLAEPVPTAPADVPELAPAAMERLDAAIEDAVEEARRWAGGM